MTVRVLKISQFQQELINMLLLQIVLHKDSILYQEITMICEYLCQIFLITSVKDYEKTLLTDLRTNCTTIILYNASKLQSTARGVQTGKILNKRKKRLMLPSAHSVCLDVMTLHGNCVQVLPWLPELRVSLFFSLEFLSLYSVLNH